VRRRRPARRLITGGTVVKRSTRWLTIGGVVTVLLGLGVWLKLKPLILDPEIVDPALYPHVVKLLKYGESDPVCGGVAIERRWVLTAAHCVARNATPKPDRLAAAATPGSLQEFTAFCHPEFAATAGEDTRNDLALLRVDTGADLVPWADGPKEVRKWQPGEGFFAFGWGKPDENLGQLQRSQPLRPVAGKKCESSLGPYQKVQPNEICADALTSGPCKLDSGGPLFTAVRSALGEWSAERELVGVISQAHGDCKPCPAIFAAFADRDLKWIVDVTAGDPDSDVAAESAAACRR
jgi:hypothetical protein